MCVTFEETKQRKLKRMVGLRIMNALGMVAWRKDQNGEADQKLRLVHPFVWVWVSLMVVLGSVMQGIPETLRDIRYSIKHDTVWF
jgi:hypothetical protein